MENKKSNFPGISILLFSSLLTPGLVICCLISMGAGHGSGMWFKSAFPLPYSLSEFLYEKAAIENSMVGLLIAGFIQNFVYFSLVEKLKIHFSGFISYSIIVGFHLILFVIVNKIYE
jgi:hypothetical protein